jgi:hypothetical protein
MRSWLPVLLGVTAAALLIFLLLPARTDREWQKDQAVMPIVLFHGNEVSIAHIRNLTYRNTSDYDLHYYDATYDLDQVQSVDFFVEEFSEWRGMAHTMLSFGFADGRYLTLSVEARKEIGEAYSPWRGMVKQYELIYIIGDERDLVRLRTNYRNHTVRRYPIDTTRENAKLLLIDMLQQAHNLRSNPDFYNTLTSTCTTNIVKHANHVTPGRIPWNWKLLAPGYADELAYDLHLINTSLSFEEIRESQRIEDAARACGDCIEFSAAIRK